MNMCWSPRSYQSSIFKQLLSLSIYLGFVLCLIIMYDIFLFSSTIYLNKDDYCKTGIQNQILTLYLESKTCLAGYQDPQVLHKLVVHVASVLLSIQILRRETQGYKVCLTIYLSTPTPYIIH